MNLVIFSVVDQSNCSDDDGGVLTGRWTDTFPKDCTLPWIWVGSVAILVEFMRTKKAVRFGQCWVFSGIVTTCKLYFNHSLLNLYSQILIHAAPKSSTELLSKIFIL